MSNLPYISTPGNIDKAVAGIKRAAVPERVSQDFVKTILKISGGSGDQMTSFLKKIGLASVDGAPTDLYRRLRNQTLSGDAIAKCIRYAYPALYIRNEFAHELNYNDLLGLIVEQTGQPHDATTVKLTISCFKHLRSLANFGETEQEVVVAPIQSSGAPRTSENKSGPDSHKSYGLNLGYTINLNLPATSDPAVFDAIFKSLKEHLLRSEDA